MRLSRFTVSWCGGPGPVLESPRWLPALLVTGLLCIAACGDSGDAAGKVPAATLGSASSPALDALSSLIDVTDIPDDDADLLVVDCKTNAPGTLARNPRVRSFLADGRSVLFLDPSAAHDAQDLMPLLHGIPAGGAHAVLTRRGRDRHHRPEYFVYAFPGAADTSPTDDELDAFRVGAERYFTLARDAAPADGSFNPPDGLLYVIYNFSLPPGSQEFTSTKMGADTSNGVQYTSVVPNVRYTLLLENGQVPTGDQQFLVAESAVEASPLNSEKLSNQLMIIKRGSGFVSCDIGWFQVEVDIGSYPEDESAFTFQTSAPMNANRVTTVNSRISLGISFLTPQGATGNYGYQSNDSTNLTSWEVVNDGNGSVGLWRYKNQDPWLWDSPDTWTDLFAFGHGVNLAGSFAVPNALAKDQIQALAKIVWATGTVLDTQETFSTSADVTYLNVWAPAFGSVHYQPVTLTNQQDWTIDMQSVLPIQITAVDFSRDPVNPRQTPSVTGTVTLANEAYVDTKVYLTSNSQNATVPPFVIIPQGESSTTFEILVNANGLERDSSTVATIAAFDATSAQAQLTVTTRR